MDNQTNNRIREEWENRFYERFGGEGTIAKTDENCILIAFTKGEVIDFIDELLKSQREELVEKIKEIPTGNHKRADMRDDIIKMLSNLSPNKENKNNGKI